MAKKSHKKAGKSVDGNSLSDTRIAPWPSTKPRGIGSSFAMAVGKVANEARGEKGSDKSEYLGKRKESIDYKRDKSMLYNGKGKKLKQGEGHNG
jgi:hypothetical protein